MASDPAGDAGRQARAMRRAIHAGLSGEASVLLGEVDLFGLRWSGRVAHRLRELAALHTRAMHDRVQAVEIMLTRTCPATPRGEAPVPRCSASACADAYRDGLDLVFTFGPEMPVTRGSIDLLGAVVGRGVFGNPPCARSVLSVRAGTQEILEDWTDWVRSRLSDRSVHPVIVVGLLGNAMLDLRACGDRTLPVVLLATTWLLRRAGYDFTAYCAIERAMTQAQGCAGPGAARPWERGESPGWVERLVRLIHSECRWLDEALGFPDRD